MAHRLAVGLVEHRQPVRQHHREPAVVVAVCELGVVDVDLAHMRTASRSSWHGKIFFTTVSVTARYTPCSTSFSAASSGVVPVTQSATGTAVESCFAFGDDDERKPRHRRRGGRPAGLRSHGSVRRLSTICGSRSPNAPSAFAGGKLDTICSVRHRVARLPRRGRACASGSTSNGTPVISLSSSAPAVMGGITFECSTKCPVLASLALQTLSGRLGDAPCGRSRLRDLAAPRCHRADQATRSPARSRGWWRADAAPRRGPRSATSAIADAASARPNPSRRRAPSRAWLAIVTTIGARCAVGVGLVGHDVVGEHAAVVHRQQHRGVLLSLASRARSAPSRPSSSCRPSTASPRPPGRRARSGRTAGSAKVVVTVRRRARELGAAHPPASRRSWCSASGSPTRERPPPGPIATPLPRVRHLRARVQPCRPAPRWRCRRRATSRGIALPDRDDALRCAPARHRCARRRCRGRRAGPPGAGRRGRAAPRAPAQPRPRVAGAAPPTAASASAFGNCSTTVWPAARARRRCGLGCALGARALRAAAAGRRPAAAAPAPRARCRTPRAAPRGRRRSARRGDALAPLAAVGGTLRAAIRVRRLQRPPSLVTTGRRAPPARR